MASIQAISTESFSHYLAVGEINLDGSLPAAICAKNMNKDFICPQSCGSEAAWASDSLRIVAPSTLLELINHLNNKQLLPQPCKSTYKKRDNLPNFAEIKGQKTIKRAL
ncbi:hypothetical protein RH08_04575 [Candidatus Liberibacter asiaticus]|uniref:Uncharacterized protein n=1 Tax=Liberibacter asiaticus (strain psy62) TaxID=537021 RepID=C6XGJ7_LIBAP|nr:hypothetical protein CLIBASIA_04645 [Candidatus Liberibacter asiaticus str. psy62]KAE9509789.1 hypothetical protein FXW22_04445 [Candidatus Liberibacter asiaticus]BAP26796.1 hypothetical protein CGUJ_04645 [Candidatus Liberibacter asiaticus str. Ishi-1]KAE9511407.1 hypothetical protein FXW31_01630 [Candidatus Liberibacter asiaticus]KAE9511938.1 hypothetical protein FXW32_04465 [Candidatus Liberibacter asiaticus]